MNFLDWLTKRKKPLSDMNRSELRRQELILEKDRTRLLNRITKIAKDKSTLFDRGADEPTPEVRRVLAQEFELKTAEQLMLSRQLNIRSKEMLTVSRLRMLRENHERAGMTGSKLGLISEKDILKLGKLIENDAVKADLYQQRLDEILSVGAEVDEGTSGLSVAGQDVMDIWERLDSGAIPGGKQEAFDEADRRVRERQATAE